MLAKGLVPSQTSNMSIFLVYLSLALNNTEQELNNNGYSNLYLVIALKGCPNLYTHLLFSKHLLLNAIHFFLYTFDRQRVSSIPTTSEWSFSLQKLAWST